jgi:transposase-like protein
MRKSVGSEKGLPKKRKCCDFGFGRVYVMEASRPPLFRNRQFEPTVIVTCVRWYLRFSLSLRDLEERMAERGLFVDHTTIWRWTQAYGPEVYRRLRGEVKRKSSRWHVDETFGALSSA